MHRLLQLLVLSMALVAAHASAETLSFEFKNAARETYHSQSIGKDLSLQNHAELKPAILLIYTPTRDDPAFRKQFGILDQNHVAEELQLLYVVASPAFENKDGYYIASSDAGRLAQKARGFQVALLNEAGLVLGRWNAPVSVAEIRKALDQATSNNSLQGRRH